MKKTKILKTILITLICISIILMGFIGIYVKDKNKYSNKLNEFNLASDLKGTTVIELEVDDTVDTTYYDKDGNKVEVSDDNTDTSEYTKEEKKVNPEENLTLENYNKTVNIIKERLNFLGTEQYSVDLDKKTGKIFVSFESKYKSDVESFLPMEGNLQIKDNKTNDIILDNTDFNNSEVTYASTEKGYTVFYNFRLNKSGIEKMNNLDKYKNQSESNEENTDDDTQQQEEQEKEEIKASILFDEEQISEVTYDDFVITGKNLRITIEKNITDTSTVNSRLNVGTAVTKLSNIGKTPLKYKLSAEEYLKSSINENTIKIIFICLAVICLGIIIYLILKYKKNGIVASIAFLTNIALFIILIRTTKVEISLNSIASIVPLLLLNLLLMNSILKNITNNEKTFKDNIKNAYLEKIDLIVILAIILVVFAFSSMSVINAMGLFMFWGWIVTVLGNLIFTIPYLYIIKDKE